MARRPSWRERLRSAWFALRTLAVRARFLTGKASFVEAEIRMTTNSLTEVYGSSGEPRGKKLLAHFQLETRKPRTGSQGWRLYVERIGDRPGHETVRLECGYCTHHFFVQVLSALDPLASELTGGRPPARPASYTADWFRFMHRDYDGQNELFCFHCEQKGPPDVSFVGPAR